MKKLLLSLAMAVGICSFVMAQEQSKALTLNNTVKADSPATEAPVTISVDGTDTGSTATQLRMKSGNKMTVSVSDGYEITKIDFGCTYVDYNLTSENVSTTPQSTITNPSNKTATVTLSAPASSIVLTIGGNIRFQKATVYYQQSVAEGEVPAPIISCDCNFVTISGKDGADFYYTLDDNTPTTSSTKYDKPFAITQDVTVKAIAVEDGTSSSVQTYEAKYETPYDGFAAFLATNPAKDTEALIEGPITAIYQGGSNMYVKDSKGGFMLLYQQGGYTGVTTENGTQFSFVKGAYDSFNGLPELKNITFGEQSSGTPVVPEQVTIKQITEAQLNHYVELTGLRIVSSDINKTFTASDNDGSTITLYNAVNITIPTGVDFTVTGFVACNGETMQITPIAVTGGTEMAEVANPVFSVPSGLVDKGTSVTLTCAQADATIYYTMGDVLPTDSSEPYTAAIVLDASTKINAIAYKEGLLPSKVVTVEYAVIPDDAVQGDFDFSDPTKLSTPIEKPESGKGVEITGQVFTTASGVKMTIGETGTGNKPVIWTLGGTGANAGKVDFRMYTGWSFTISAPDKYLLAGVEMSKFDGNFAITPSAGTFTPDGNTATWMAPVVVTLADDNAYDGKSVTFTANGTTRIQTIKVYVVPVSGQNGIEDVIMGDEDAPVEYYNLQGVRVMNPTAGLYIVKQGSKVSKAILR
jgi:hypothetical protein